MRDDRKIDVAREVRCCLLLCLMKAKKTTRQTQYPSRRTGRWMSELLATRNFDLDDRMQTLEHPRLRILNTIVPLGLLDTKHN